MVPTHGKSAVVLQMAALVGTGCASDDDDGRDGVVVAPDSGRDDGGYPSEKRSISLTLMPIYSVDDLLAAAPGAPPESLGGVRVCVKMARPHLSEFESFTALDVTTRPCATSEANEVIVLEGVPTDSELVITAENEGFWPSVITAVTSAWSADASDFGPVTSEFRLLPRDSQWPDLGSAPTASTGLLAVRALTLFIYQPRWLVGATASLSPGPAEGPIYSDGVTLDRDAPGTPSVGWDPSEFPGENARPGPDILFAGVPEGDHVIHIEHPLAECRPAASIYGAPVHGFFSDAPGEIRVPVLAGHFVPGLRADCFCANVAGRTLDHRTCEEVPPSMDGGAL